MIYNEAVVSTTNVTRVSALEKLALLEAHLVQVFAVEWASDNSYPCSAPKVAVGTTDSARRTRVTSQSRVPHLR